MAACFIPVCAGSLNILLKIFHGRRIEKERDIMMWYMGTTGPSFGYACIKNNRIKIMNT